MRLIDADANIETMKKCAANPESEQALLCYRYTQRILEEAPTVEPAYPWRRVEDVLPRGQELVIVAVKDTAGDTPFWYTQCGWITTDGEYWIVDNEICDYVVAWMPLPEPPKDGNNGSSRKEASSDL